MANIINDSHEKLKSSNIIFNEINFLEKSNNEQHYNTNFLLVFFSPIITIFIGKFIALFNIIALIGFSLYKNTGNLNEIITKLNDAIIRPIIESPQSIIDNYKILLDEFIKIISSYVDIYFYINLFYFLTFLVAFAFVLALFKKKNISSTTKLLSSFQYIKSNITNLIIAFVLGVVSSLIICILISIAGDINIVEKINTNNTFRLFLMSFANIIAFAFIHEYLFRGFIPIYFWNKLTSINDKILRYIFLNAILILSSILFVVTLWGVNFLLIINFLFVSIFYRILTSITYSFDYNIYHLIAFNLVGTLISGYPILSFKDQYNLRGHIIIEHTIFNGGTLGILGTVFSTIIFSLLIFISIYFYNSITKKIT